MKASSNRPVSAPVPETAPHVGARFIAPWAADNPPSSPIAASFAARKPRARARLATPNLDPATQKIWAEEHALAFTVAGMARDDILAALRDGLTEVIAGKLSREEWLDGARARLIKAGYWREKGEKGGITPSRLQLIFDTNTANAYHGGRWQRLEERRETHPYLMYLTKRDHRVRPEHRAWEGLILPIDHPFWQSHFPPNGFRCRCAVLGVTQAEYDQLKRDGGQFAGGQVKFDNDVDADLEALDPGFAYNPGIPGSRAAALQRLAEEKAARAEQRAARRAAAAQARAAKKAARDAQRAASAEAEAKREAKEQITMQPQPAPEPPAPLPAAPKTPEAAPATPDPAAQPPVPAPEASAVDIVRALTPKLEVLPAETSRDMIQEMVQSDDFARWYAKPTRGVLWPMVRIPDADARAMGAKDGVRVAKMSSDTALKQIDHHPDLTPADYARAQNVVDAPTNKKSFSDPQTGRKKMLYIQEGERYVLIVKADKEGDGLFFTSYYRLHTDEAKKDKEISRLLRNAKK